MCSAMRFSVIFTVLVLMSFSVKATDIETYRGVVDVAGTPQRIIAFPAGVVDTLDALGVKLVGMPAGIHLNYIDQNQASEVGTLFTADLEAIHRLQPDFVVVGTRSAKQFESVSEIAPTVDLSLARGNTYQAAIQRMNDLARLFDKVEQAKSIEHELTQLRDQVAASVSKTGSVMVVMVIGRSLNMLTAKTRIDWFQSELGMTLVGDDSKQLGELAPISFEYILAQNPDWLIVMDRDAAVGKPSSNVQQQMNNPLVNATAAARKGQIVYLDGVGTLNAVGGVQGLKNTLQQLEQVFNDPSRF
ncbi:iron complex transport system substrate-binding protein [Marinomonas aquiplantarum]|uniref:Iron complex transport system substrate-binding protein n=2 Tax=Marinomonas aquiplantarum TaxID=491951 RepID=A0A366CTJ7_9GAMM|nr:iron complex transport system substrate-binding protein [Marinomonas aquiplantarum]